MGRNVPRWQSELANFKGIKSLFVLEKNINDIYPFYFEDCMDSPEFIGLEEVLFELFGKAHASGDAGYQVLFYDPLNRFTNPFHDSETVRYLTLADRAAATMKLEGSKLNDIGGRKAQNQVSGYVHDSEVIRALLSCNLAAEEGSDLEAQEAIRPVAVIVNMASRMISAPDGLDDDERTFLLNIYTGASNALRVSGMGSDRSYRNALILAANNLRDLPEWFVASNPNIRSIVVPVPDRIAREGYVRQEFRFDGSSYELEEKSPSERFVDMTDSMTLREIDELRRMYERDALSENDLNILVDVYKYGFKENKWASMAEKLKNDPAAQLRRRVKGQEQAVGAVVSVLKRSVLGLSGGTHSSSSKPKGVLFLSGPTGTGKTEIVKAVTELLFGDERSCLRFDMSEYQAEASDQKLFGAPPGYVGYAQGGQLTNAVKANPFSVILFDEIEKAHPSVMDKFLQILEDGRMTDGQGNTVYFSEALIFFTSNIGFTEEVRDPSGLHVVDHVSLIEPDEPYDIICEKVQQAMSARFKPEFLGRIGNNVVVFNFIDADTAAEILEQKIEAVNRRIERNQGIVVTVSPECMGKLVHDALAPEVKAKGGRGIANFVETEYLNAISDFIFDSSGTSSCSIRVGLDSSGMLTFIKEGAK